MTRQCRLPICQNLHGFPALHRGLFDDALGSRRHGPNHAGRRRRPDDLFRVTARRPRLSLFLRHRVTLRHRVGAHRYISYRAKLTHPQFSNPSHRGLEWQRPSGESFGRRFRHLDDNETPGLSCGTVQTTIGSHPPKPDRGAAARLCGRFSLRPRSWRPSGSCRQPRPYARPSSSGSPGHPATGPERIDRR